ncbi:MAG TPA: HD domain-containing phosphohydrolase [Paucimonas sp.]|nr:HD domain-containing phosphohydrolase [Paucimonas sp.]
MADDIQIEQVNQHYLDKVMDLAEELDVEASEDIFDARGMKLIAKGAKISSAQQEKLIMHKLRKPLEACIIVHGGVNANMVQLEAQRIAQEIEAVACILKATPTLGAAPLDVIQGLELGSAMSLMLTIMERGGQAAFEHAVMVSLMSVCFAKKLGLTEQNQAVAGLAGLLHDIGELYIAPEYLLPGRRLLPHEWRHVIVHPRIGQMLIDQIERYPPAVGVAVSEHHERYDGGGYPRQAAGRQISAPGLAVSAAEMIAAVYVKSDHPLERAELALKIIPGEHEHLLVAAVSQALHLPHAADAAPGLPSAPATARLHRLLDRIGAATRHCQHLLALPTITSAKAKKLLSRAEQRIETIERAFSSVGLDVCATSEKPLLAVDAHEADTALVFEASAAAQELEWRLCDAARDIALHSVELDPHEAQAFESLIALLDEQRAA